ncbi:hypothetical protein SAY87_025674 [Trapa incisa]|uniref:Bromo domain-containing protein n=1 Tax=Trapa incisa TaxID=236973 RepID=A0AAN7H1P9_9MYRT|nr:hypothetical protein SAY87_025674 [Trapa incisa]
MGKVVEKKRKKKKGRPSLLDLQRQSLKEQKESHEHENSAPKVSQNYKISTATPLRRSTRRNPASDCASSSDDHSGDDSSPGGRRREKKLNLVLQVPNSISGNLDESDSVAAEDEDVGQDHRKRKIAAIDNGSGAGVSSEKGEKPTKSASTDKGIQPDSEVSAPLSDKKLLLLILDRVQKKDTYGVFSEPVDPEELPDYHDIIEHPMDFGTVRKKLDDGAYANMEQFESDVYLICSNALQYNAPDTVYFRQARSMQELARKHFDSLRQNGDNNGVEPKIVRRGRPPTKHLKRPPGRPPLDRSSDVTLAIGGEKTMSANYLKKGPYYGDRLGLMTPLGGFRNHDVHSSWLFENKLGRNDEVTGSSLKGSLTKLGNKLTIPEENRRDTYRHFHPFTSGHEPFASATAHWERKQLMPVGLHSDHGYARSLARFAANLGPIAWKVASKMIERSLPAGVKFGPGWVGENDLLPQRQFQISSPALSSLCLFSTPGSSDPKNTDHHFQDDPRDVSAEKPQEEHSDPVEKHPPLVPSSDTLLLSENISQPITKEMEVADRSNLMRPQIPIYKNGFTSPYGYDNNLASAHAGKMMAAKPSSRFHPHPNPKGLLEVQSTFYSNSLHQLPPDSMDGEVPKTSQINSSHGRSPLLQQNPEPGVPLQQWLQSAATDLNVRFHSPGSPNSSRANSAHPDLALQL